MKRTIMMAAFAAAAILTGCNKNEMSLPQGKAFTATITEQPEMSDASRVTFEDDANGGFVINWDANDLASINGVTYKAKTGGGVTSDFVPQTAGKEAVENSGSPKWEVYYPHEITNTKNGTTKDDPDDYWPLYLGTSQAYEENSVDKMPMRAVSDDESLAFICLSGIIQVNLKCTSGSMTLKNIKLQTKDKPLGGPFVVEGDKAVGTNTTNTPIVLSCEKRSGSVVTVPGKVIDSEGYVALNLSAFDGTYPTLTITIANDQNVTKAISLKAGKSIIVERAKITRINLTIDPADFESGAGGGDDTEVSEDRIIRYTTSDGAIVTPAYLPNGYSIVSNVYENGVGTMTFSIKVQTISARAFEGFTTLTSMELPDCLTNISNYAFQNCTNLKSIDTGTSLGVIGANAFYGCSSLESIVIPESVTAINNNAFQNCTSLASVTMPEEAQFKTIPMNTFAGCTSLVNITIPEGPTTIGTKAFQNCAITEITLPSTLTYVTKQAFDGCKSLKNVIVKRYIAGASPEITEIQAPDTQYLTFRNTALENIYVPAEAVAFYQAHDGWQGKDGAWAALIKANPAE